MNTRLLIILASARKQSDTRAFVDKVFANIDHRLIDLLDFHISPYDYSDNYPANDEFSKVVDEILEHQVIVFATPVYWYAMSGLMKNLFDRFTDLVTTRKQLGRQLKGKTTFLLAVGADEELPTGFETPFLLTSIYLGLSYQGAIYYSKETSYPAESIQKTIQLFTNIIENHSC